MTRAFKVLTFQASALAAGLLMMSVAADLAKAAPAPAAAAVTIDNFTFKAPVVVSKDGVFKSKVLDTGDKFSFTFAKAGQFGYFCSLHPHMTGMVIVKA
jgi:acyl dehydratase